MTEHGLPETLDSLDVVDSDGNTIVGSWESSSDGEQWTPDFTLTYSRVR